MKELLIVAKFKEKVKHSENTLGQLIASDDKVSNIDEVIEETEESQVDGYTLIKEESDVEEEVIESYEEVEFLDLQGQSETLTGVRFVTIDKCGDDDEFIDGIIEECSVEENDFDDGSVVNDETCILPDIPSRSTVKVCVHHLWQSSRFKNISFQLQKSTPKQTAQHLNPSDSKVIINFNCAFCGAGMQFSTYNFRSTILFHSSHLGFMHSSNLKRHMTTHGSDPFALSVNDSNDTMKMEEIPTPRVVSGKISKKNVVKPHQCEHCDRAFVSRSLLSSHVRTHTGER